MQLIASIFSGFAILLGLTALVTGDAQTTADVADKGGSTIGMTAGGLLGSIPDMVDGFNRARGDESILDSTGDNRRNDGPRLRVRERNAR